MGEVSLIPRTRGGWRFVHAGVDKRLRRAGTGRFIPAIARGTGGRSLAVLPEDRGSR